MSLKVLWCHCHCLYLHSLPLPSDFIKCCIFKDVLIDTQLIQGFVLQRVVHQNQGAMSMGQCPVCAHTDPLRCVAATLPTLNVWQGAVGAPVGLIWKTVPERCVLIPYSRGHSQKQQNRLCPKTYKLEKFLFYLLLQISMALFTTLVENGISGLNNLMTFCCNIFHSLAQALNCKVFLLSNLYFSALQFQWFYIFATTDACNPKSLSFIILNAF